jgi:hypothetical protein
VGLFYNSDTRLSRAFPIIVKRYSHKVFRYSYSNRVLNQFNHSTLLKRGWVLRERVISPRFVYFGEQIVWECTESLANELLPRGKACTFAHSPELEEPLRLTSLLADESPHWGEPNVYLPWQLLVENYSNCVLTFEDDLSPVISGLVRRFGKLLHDN